MSTVTLKFLREPGFSSLLLVLAALAAIGGCAGGDSIEETKTLEGPVIGGGPATAGQAPWIVQIAWPNGPPNGYPHWCGGALLPDTLPNGTRWVVTAAHCIDGVPFTDLVVKAGEHDRSVSEPTEQVRSSIFTRPHPRYARLAYKNDVGLIQLDSPITFNASAQPIALPEGRYGTPGTGTVWGWGQTSVGAPTPSNLLMKVDLPLVDHTTCGPPMSAIAELLPAHLCAGYANGSKTGCHGDSGGPFTALNGAGVPQVIGLVSWGDAPCTQYSIFADFVEYVPWIRSITIGQPFSCQGQTVAGYTNWQDYVTNSIYTDVDTTQCAFEAAPLYFTSLGGASNHFTTQGATSIYSPTSEGFRVYLRKGGITAAQANAMKWHINWQGVPLNQSRPEICSGRTTPGSTSWVQYNTRSVYVDVNTSSCNRTTTPRYFTSLGGSSSHYATLGATSIYSPTPTGFRIYVVQEDITPARANQRSWHINWAATPTTPQTSISQCTGSTTPGANWVQYSTNAVYLDVNTSSCQRTVKPLYFTSLGAFTAHFDAYGPTSIYQPTGTGFRVYLNQPGITVAEAALRQYFINWAAYP